VPETMLSRRRWGIACADDTSLSATGTEIELSSLRRKGLGIGGKDPVSEVPHDVAQDGELPIAKGPKIVVRFQGLDPPGEGSGKLIDVGILSGSLRGSSKQVKRISNEIPYSIFGLEGQGRFCSS